MSIFWHNITSFGKVSLAINQPIKSYRSFFENTFRRFTNFHQKSLYLWKRIRLIKKILLRQKSSIPLTLNRVKYTVGEHKAIYLRPLVCGKSHLVCLMSTMTRSYYLEKYLPCFFSCTHAWSEYFLKAISKYIAVFLLLS